MATRYELVDLATKKVVRWTEKGRNAAIAMHCDYHTQHPSANLTMFVGPRDGVKTRLWDFPPLTA